MSNASKTSSVRRVQLLGLNLPSMSMNLLDESCRRELKFK